MGTCFTFLPHVLKPNVHFTLTFNYSGLIKMTDETKCDFIYHEEANGYFILTFWIKGKAVCIQTLLTLFWTRAS